MAAHHRSSFNFFFISGLFFLIVRPKVHNTVTRVVPQGRPSIHEFVSTWVNVVSLEKTTEETKKTKFANSVPACVPVCVSIYTQKLWNLFMFIKYRAFLIMNKPSVLCFVRLHSPHADPVARCQVFVCFHRPRMRILVRYYLLLAVLSPLVTVTTPLHHPLQRERGGRLFTGLSSTELR